MGMDNFKDMVFELLNDADNMNIIDIETNDRENTFKISFQNGNTFELECRKL